jgi:hypothetical protein
MSGPTLLSSTLSAPLLQWVNNLLGLLVTTPGGNTPVSLSASQGDVALSEVDCTGWTLQVAAPGTASAPGNVTLSFPGSQISVTGYINPSLLGALMTPNTAQLANAAQLAGANVTFAGPSLAKAKSGQVIAQCSVTGSVNPQQTVTVQLYRDNVLLAAALSTPGGVALASDFAVALHYLDTLPDGNPHSYSAQIATNGASAVIPVGGALITLFEL